MTLKGGGYLMVYWNGDLGLCCWDADKYMNLGNIKDSSIIELFNSPTFKEIRKNMLELNCEDLYPFNQCSQIYGCNMNLAIFNKRVRIKK